MEVVDVTATSIEVVERRGNAVNLPTRQGRTGRGKIVPVYQEGAASLLVASRWWVAPNARELALVICNITDAFVEVRQRCRFPLAYVADELTTGVQSGSVHRYVFAGSRVGPRRERTAQAGQLTVVVLNAADTIAPFRTPSGEPFAPTGRCFSIATWVLPRYGSGSRHSFQLQI